MMRLLFLYAHGTLWVQLFMITSITALTVFTVIANLYLGGVVLIRNPKSATHRLFALYTLAVASWALTNYLLLQSGSEVQALIRLRYAMLSGGLIMPLLYLLVKTFPGDRLKYKPVNFFFFILFVVGTNAIAFTRYVFDSVDLSHNVPIATPHSGIFIYGLNVAGLAVLTIITLLRRIKRTTGRQHHQLQLLMWAVVITYTLSEFSNFILVNFFNTPQFVILGPFFTLILVGVIFYAVTKQKFLDIRPLIVRSVSYILVLLIITGVYVFGSFISIQYLFHGVVLSSNAYIFTLFLSFIVGISSSILYKRLQKVIGKYFFKTMYKSEDLVFASIQTMVTEVDFDITGPKVMDSLMKTIGITCMAIIVVEHHQVTHIKTRGDGFTSLSTNLQSLQVLEDIFHLPHIPEILILEDLEDSPLKEVLRSLDIQAIIPIHNDAQEIGFLVCGPRSSGDIYTQQDIAVLKIIANQVGENIESTRKFKMLKVVDTIKSDFINSVSHEFRTPLTESRWKIESILSPEYGKPLAPELRKDLVDVYFSMRWLVESLNQVTLALSLESAAPVLNPEEVDIRSYLTDEIFNVVNSAAELKKISIKLHIEGDVAPISLDRLKMKEVFLVLVENAIKYSPDQSEVTITISERTLSDVQRFLHIEIHDSGIGITDEDIPHMFSKFYRGGSARHAAPNGLGLGLYIAKNIIEAHGGKIWAESHAGGGSTFFVELPYRT